MRTKLPKAQREEKMKQFQREILDIVHLDRLTVIEAITQYCEDKELDVTDVVSLISPSMKSQLYDEAVKYRFIKDKDTHLPI